MKQVLIEKISKNKELPKTMLEVYRSLGLKNYRFECEDSQINNYTKICMITKSLNGHDWNSKINKNLQLYYPCFEWNNSSGEFVFCFTFINEEYYYVNFPFGFKTRKLAEYAAINFIDQYNKWLIIPKNESKLIEEVGYLEIKTMFDVYRVNGITKLTTLPETKERYYEDLILVSKALNGNWKPDWNNMNEYKWFPYFEFSSKFRFSHATTNYSYIHTVAGIGSQLCFKNKYIAEYARKTFIEQYQKLMKF